MKLICCQNCGDTFTLILKHERICRCGKVGGQLVDSFAIKVFGDPAVIGLDNRTLAKAIKNRPDSGRGLDFNAFIICKYNGQITHYKR